jgi:hypothetical protein
MMRRVRAKAVISKGLMVVVGMNWEQGGGFADQQGVFYWRELRRICF